MGKRFVMFDLGIFRKFQTGQRLDDNMRLFSRLAQRIRKALQSAAAQNNRTGSIGQHV